MTYVAAVRKLLRRYDVYSLFWCFSYIRDAGYGEEFKDVGDGQTSLSRGIFEWLVSLRPSHLVYRRGDTATWSLMSRVDLLVSSGMTDYI